MFLFDDHIQIDSSPRRESESDFDYYDRVAGRQWDRVRHMLNTWLEHLPEDKQPPTISKMKQKKVGKFLDTFWELYLHESFLRMGFDVTFEPEVARNARSPLTPDLLVEKGEHRFYIDATVVNDRQAEEKKIGSQHKLEEFINQRITGYPNIVLRVAYQQTGELHELRTSAVVKNISSCLDEITSHPTRPVLSSQGKPSSAIGAWTFRANGWVIDFRVHEVDSPRGTGRIIGSIQRGIEMIEATTDPHKFRDDINDKAKQYEHLDAPLLVAVLLNRASSGYRDLKFALFGDLGTSEEILRTGILDPSWPGDIDGVWATKRGPRRRNVPAIIAIDGLTGPALVEEVRPSVWINPWAVHGVVGLFAWPSVIAVADEERLTLQESEKPHLFEGELGSDDGSPPS